MGGAARLMYDIARNIKRKYIVTGILALFGLIILIAVASGGLVLIRSHELGGVDIIFEGNGTEDGDRDFSLEAGGWRLLYLNSGEYRMSGYDETRESVYQINVSPLSWLTLDIDLKNQKQSTNLGYRNSDCLFDSKQTNQLIFYFCNKSLQSLGFFSVTRDGIDSQDIRYGDIVKPYKDGLLSLDARGGWVIQQWGPRDGTLAAQKTYDIPNQDEGENVSESSLLTDTSDTDNPVFAYFNDKKKVAIVYGEFDDNNPMTINLADYMKSSELFSYELQLIGKQLYLYKMIKIEGSPGFADSGERISDKAAGSIHAFNLSSGKLDTHINLPAGIYNNLVATSKAGDTAVSTANKEGRNEKVYFYEDGQQKDTATLRGTTDMCWGKAGLYYTSTHNSDSINLYSPADRSSTVVYRNISDNIAGVQCVNGDVYFYSLSQDDTNSDYRWFALDNGDFTNGVRVEGIFPIFDDPSGIDYSYVFKNRIVVELRDNGSCDVTDDARARIKDYIKSLGVDVSTYQLDISRTCSN